MTTRSSGHAVSFYIAGDVDINRDAHGTTTNKALFADGVPVKGGLYDPAYGTTELVWDCQSCMKTKKDCGGHQGKGLTNYPLSSPIFRKEIIKWLKICCHTCGEFWASKKMPTEGVKSRRLTATAATSRQGIDTAKMCAHCGAQQPHVSRDATRHGVIWREYASRAGKEQKKEILYNTEIARILNRIPDHVITGMGKHVDSGPKKLLRQGVYCIPSTVIRPEIRKIGGNRASMSDITALLKNLFELNSQIPREIPQNVDKDLHTKLVLMDLTFFEMIRGSSTGTSGLKLVTNTNKISHSIASRLSKKTGRLRGNLMGKRTRKMMRSVITGDKAIRPDQCGVPRMLADEMPIPETLQSWNRERLMGYLTAPKGQTPRVIKIKRADTGREHYVDGANERYVPQDGDVFYRTMKDGDLVGMCREPALLYSNIAVFSVKIVSGMTLRINSGVSVGFNADFDGDEMNLMVMKNQESIVETMMTSGIDNWFVSYKNSQPLYGLFQDSVIGIYEMTHTRTSGILKYYAMDMMNRTETSQGLNFPNQSYTGRELVSMLLPPINYEGKAKFYVPEFSPYINYCEDDIKVKIVNGKLVSGVLDKESMGQEAEGGVFHIIYNAYGPSEAIDTIYNLQQITNHFIYYHGVTFGLRDIYLTLPTRRAIKMETSKIIAACDDITKQYNEGKLIPPIGMTHSEYFEELQMAALDHGDEFIKPVLQEINIDDNWLWKFIWSGSKGAKSNLLSIYTSIGSIGIRGSRIAMQMLNRTSLNFTRFSTDPISRGYNPSNFMEGIQPLVYPFSAMEARVELTEVALSTAKAGTMNRDAIKNLESIIVGNSRGAVKAHRVVQLLAGDTGFDPRYMQKVKFPTTKISNADFESRYHVNIKQVDQKWQNSHTQTRLDREFQQLSDDRREYRSIMMELERNNRGNFMFTDSARLPVNTSLILTNVVTTANEAGPIRDATTRDVLDPVAAANLVDEYCSSIGYLFMNELKRKAKTEIPAHIQNAVTFMRISVRSSLCTAELLRVGAGNRTVEVVLEQISHKIVSSLIFYGKSIGIIAAESMSEPITQFLLDAKHRSGLRKSKTNAIVRFEELINNKPTEKLHNPQMILVPREEDRGNKQKTIEIANHIEMLPVNRFVSHADIYLEQYGRPVYPGLEHESRMISRSATLSIGDKVPGDLVNWCIRLVFREEDLILKNMKVKTIYTKLMEKFPNIWIAYTPQARRGDTIFRIYVRNIAFKSGLDVDLAAIRGLMGRILETVIRGVNGIYNTRVREMPGTYERDDGSIDMRKSFVIETDGSNLSGILSNPYLDQYQCQTNSVREIEKAYGIDAARCKIANELNAVLKGGPVFEHSTIYADEMTFIGKVTSIQRAGLGKREADYIFLRATFGSPVNVFEDACINSRTDFIQGMSAPLAMGTTPRFGTTYNGVSIDEDAVIATSQSVEEVLDSL